MLTKKIQEPCIRINTLPYTEEKKKKEIKINNLYEHKNPENSVDFSLCS